MKGSGIRILFACTLAACAAECAPTDTGNPPFAIDTELLDGSIVSGDVMRVISITGQPGSVEPPTGSAVLRRREGSAEVARAAVRPDGSFSLQAEDSPGIYLLRIEDDDRSSDTIEVRVTDTDITFVSAASG